MKQTARIEIHAVALERGWRYIEPANDLHCTPVEYRRKSGPHMEYVRCVFDVYGRVIEASWGPTLWGSGSKIISKYTKNKREWTLEKLRGESR